MIVLSAYRHFALISLAFPYSGLTLCLVVSESDSRIKFSVHYGLSAATCHTQGGLNVPWERMWKPVQHATEDSRKYCIAYLDMCKGPRGSETVVSTDICEMPSRRLSISSQCQRRNAHSQTPHHPRTGPACCHAPGPVAGTSCTRSGSCHVSVASCDARRCCPGACWCMR